MQGGDRHPGLASVEHGQGGLLAFAPAEVDPDEALARLVRHWIWLR
jgi:hypothetical protein